MPPTVVSPLYWNYWANVIYILGMFGYLTIDSANYLFAGFQNDLSIFIYVFLAILFALSAILYAIDWYVYAVKLREDENEPIHYRAELIACMFQNVGCYLYLLGATLAFHQVKYMKTILLLNFFAILAFLTESSLIFLGWRMALRRQGTSNPKRGCVAQDVCMWAHLLYFIGNVIYLCSTSLAYRFYVDFNVTYPNGVVILQIFGDLIYLLDAYLYYECWKRDKQEYDANTERQNLVKLNVVKQLSTENFANDMKIDSDN
ncbi:unnamed protein product [Adineta ricciae]|uniref:Uncharacterized protein n=2 Tax=Adineta ricciae TaxID=249248 RepID=A0A814YCG8_ADIRI|nr:unnamed protein product [Adineta ricciae]CAF1227323.1 unnamed protein product [Adineta ricciae]